MVLEGKIPFGPTKGKGKVSMQNAFVMKANGIRESMELMCRFKSITADLFYRFPTIAADVQSNNCIPKRKTKAKQCILHGEIQPNSYYSQSNDPSCSLASMAVDAVSAVGVAVCSWYCREIA